MVIAALCCAPAGTTSNPDENDDTNVPVRTRTQSCQDYGAALCGAYFRCATSFAVVYEDEAACSAAFHRTCMDSFDRSTAASIATVDACAPAISSATCDDLWTVGVPACDRLYGSLQPGAACRGGAECSSGYCDGVTTTACGLCVSRGGIGSSCSNSVCEPGLTCAANEICVNYATRGTSCDANHPCHLNDACVAGTCQARRAAGATCSTSDECEVLNSAVCLRGTCTVFQTAQPAEECGSSVLKLCAANGFCRGATSTMPGTCVAAAQEGQACSATEGPKCEKPLGCSSLTNTCKFLVGPDFCQ